MPRALYLGEALRGEKPAAITAAAPGVGLFFDTDMENF
jgi:hypothetical protein